jgi:hypothetical protein
MRNVYLKELSKYVHILNAKHTKKGYVGYKARRGIT